MYFQELSDTECEVLSKNHLKISTSSEAYVPPSEAYIPLYTPFRSLDTPQVDREKDVKEWNTPLEPLYDPLSPDGSLLFTNIFQVGMMEEEEEERPRREESHAEPVSPHSSEDSRTWTRVVNFRRPPEPVQNEERETRLPFRSEKRKSSKSDGERSRESTKKSHDKKKRKKKMEKRLLKKLTRKFDREKRRSSDERTRETDGGKKSVDEYAEKKKEMETLHLVAEKKHVFKKPAPPPKRPVPRATDFLKKYKIPRLNTTPEFPKTVVTPSGIPKEGEKMNVVVIDVSTKKTVFKKPEKINEKETLWREKDVLFTPSGISKEGEKMSVVVIDVPTRKTVIKKISPKKINEKKTFAKSFWREEDVLFINVDREEYDKFQKDEEKLEKIMWKYRQRIENKNRFLYY